MVSSPGPGARFIDLGNRLQEETWEKHLCCLKITSSGKGGT